MKKTSITILLALIALTSWAFATSDEAACGKYWYRGSDLSVQFSWKLDGVHDLVLNGKRYRGILPIESLGRYGATGLYKIPVLSSDTRNISIQLFILFDETEAVRQAGAFYVETTTVPRGTGKDWILKKSVQMSFRFVPLPPDERL